MADEATTQAADSSAASEQAQGSADSESETTQGTHDSGDAGQQTGAEGGQADTGKTDQKPADQGEQKTDSKPVSRRSAAFRIKQQAQTIRDLKQKLGDSTGHAGDNANGGDNTGDKAPTASDIQRMVQEGIAQALKPYESATTKTADDAELNDLFAGKPDEKTKYEPQIRERWNLPQYKDLSASDLLKIVSFDDAVKAATEHAIAEFKKADKEAKEHSTGGHSTSNRTGSKGKSVSEMTPEEFQRHNQEVLSKL